MRFLKYIIPITLLAGAAILCGIRWKAWFNNPPEAPWNQDTISYHFYTFGEDSIPGFIKQSNGIYKDTIQSDTFRLLLLGDVHNGIDSLQYRNMYLRHKPLDCYAQVGDFMERCYFCYYQLLVRELIHTGFDSIPILAVPGNHEYMKGIVRHLPEMWTEWFSNPLNGPDRFKGSTYYVDFQNLRFIVIDTNGLQRLSDYTTVLTWLNRTLCEAGSRYTVVMMHHPVLSGAVGRQNMVIKVAFYDALNKADIVFSGHDHNYTRRLPFIGTNSAKKFYLSKVNHKDTRICSGKQLYNVLTLCNDTLTIETFLMDSGEKYDEIQVIHHTNNERQYIDNWSGKKEIIELPEKYEKRHNIKVSKFYRRRNLRMAKDTIL